MSEKKEENFTVECNVCGQHFENWVGSTPCCGSVAYLLDQDGKKTEAFMVYGHIEFTKPDL